jgi:DNA polymerase-4
MDAGVIHINIPFFMASVESLLNKRMSRMPFVFSSSHSHYSPVLDVSPLAYEMGIRRGMTLGEARRCARDIVVVRPESHRYLKMIGCIEKVIQGVTPVYEVLPTGEAYLNIKGSRWLFKSEEDIAAILYRSVYEDTGLRPRIGIGTNKLISRVASSFFYDEAFIKVVPGEEEVFVSPLSVTILPDLDRWVVERLFDYNIFRVGEIRRLGMENLHTIFGKIGRTLELWARGIDTGGIVSQNIPFLREELSLSYEENRWDVLKSRLFHISSSIGFELRRKGVAAGRFRLAGVYADNLTFEGYAGARPAVNTDLSIFRLLKNLFFRTVRRRIYVKSIVVEASLFCPVFVQGELVDLPSSREFRLHSAIDSIRNRFGEGSIYFGIESTV